jgi:hypothetical protein
MRYRARLYRHNGEFAREIETVAQSPRHAAANALARYMGYGFNVEDAERFVAGRMPGRWVDTGPACVMVDVEPVEAATDRA